MEGVAAMQYNPRAFLRQVPNALQARFFSRYEAFSTFDWSRQKETQVEAVFERWQQMPEAERRQVGGVFRQVHFMASSRGTRVLVEAARDRGLEMRQTWAPGRTPMIAPSGVSCICRRYLPTRGRWITSKAYRGVPGKSRTGCPRSRSNSRKRPSQT
jgi:hypothetical protein